ncbi:glycine-rich RNA-binding protein 3, mitochondrial-like [Penaeus japonicus]|uniref:glycine-rich RNA-binding protein 3, mitochondrial-like n=1 Tax=Penaeus japonicus TaxID=27405 RepID=UPI001C714FA5|nr:glycine-rich RNA-binding protein 3, mitochondrial-like [Penaeus japonicus]
MLGHVVVFALTASAHARVTYRWRPIWYEIGHGGTYSNEYEGDVNIYGHNEGYDDGGHYGNSGEYANSGGYGNSGEYANSGGYANSEGYGNSEEYDNGREYDSSQGYDNFDGAEHVYVDSDGFASSHDGYRSNGKFDINGNPIRAYGNSDEIIRYTSGEQYEQDSYDSYEYMETRGRYGNSGKNDDYGDGYGKRGRNMIYDAISNFGRLFDNMFSFMHGGH